MSKGKNRNQEEVATEVLSSNPQERSFSSEEPELAQPLTVAHVPPNGNLVATFKPDANIKALVTTVDCSTVEGRQKVHAMATGTSLKMADLIGQTIEVQDYAAFPDTIVSEQTGQLQQILRVVMLLTDGRTVGSTSPFVYGDLATYKDFVMGGTWLVPIEFVAEEHKRKNGMGVFHKLRAPIKSLNILGSPRKREQPATQAEPLA